MPQETFHTGRDKIIEMALAKHLGPPKITDPPVTASAGGDTPARRIVALLIEKAQIPEIEAKDLDFQFAFRYINKERGLPCALLPQGPWVDGKFWTVDDILPTDLLRYIKEYINTKVPEMKRDLVRGSVMPTAEKELVSSKPTSTGASGLAGLSAFKVPLAPKSGNSSGFKLPPSLAAKPATKTTTKSATKRTHDEAVDENQFALGSDDEDDMIRMDKNCDQVRRMIRNYIDSGAMKIGRFCDAIGVSNKSYNTFLGQSGRDKGYGSSTYIGALQFFQKREAAGLPMPKKARTNKATASTVASAPSTTLGPTSTAAFSVGAIMLPGEEDDSVAVYDTCGDIRKKINAHMKKPGVTQAQFLRDLMAQFHTEDKRIQGSQLQRFRGQSGETAGNTNPCYYAGYVFFEKMRIKEGKKKSAKREEMEEIHPGGMNTTERSSGMYWMGPGESAHEDKYGVVHFSR